MERMQKSKGPVVERALRTPGTARRSVWLECSRLRELPARRGWRQSVSSVKEFRSTEVGGTSGKA